MSSIADAQATILSGMAIEWSTIAEAMSALPADRFSFADLYCQSQASEYWSLENGVVSRAGVDFDCGFGFRVVQGEQQGFAFSNVFTEQALAEAIRMASAGGTGAVPLPGVAMPPVHPNALYRNANPLLSVSEADKVSFLLALDSYARRLSPAVEGVMLSLSGDYDVVLMIDHEGNVHADARPLVQLTVRVIVVQAGRRESGFAAIGCRDDYQAILTTATAEPVVAKAVTQALTNLESVEAPVGQMPVVLGPGWPAVLLHEAVGHGLEADFNRKGSSVFSGRIGEQVASPLCTVIDDGTLSTRRGSLQVDDEGCPTERTCLIERGQLQGYMQDRQSAQLMGMPRTGNGRRESYAHLPLPRMTNTFLMPGETPPEEIIRSVDRGLYVADLSGGQVDITSGQFVFSTSEAYLIEQGRITRPVKGASLVGDGLTVLQQISAVGSDWSLDPGLGVCGKSGQSVPVGVGQPTVKVAAMTVGGQ